MSERKKYDLFNGGLNQLLADLETQRKALSDIKNDIEEEIAFELVKEIEQEAQTIYYDEQAFNAVSNNNRVMKTDKGHKVLNTTQQATYSEYGTGIIGENSPHTDPRMSWEYDLNSHGEKGWRYTDNGQSVFTLGLPSNRVYYRSAQSIRKRLPELVKEVIKRRKENQ